MAITSRIATAARSQRKRVPRSVGPDSIAGLTGAIGSVPSGMAAGTLAGVNPIYGLYASIAGPIFGGIFSSSQLMFVTTTNAAALAAAESLSQFDGNNKAEALFLLTVLAGLMQLAAGLLRLGRFVRFVSHSVMIGFLTGIAVLIILGQIPNFTGFGTASGSNKLSQTFDVVTHPGQIDAASLLIGILAIALAVILSRTRLRLGATLLALVVPSALVLVPALNSVELIGDASQIPSSLPIPSLPSLSLMSVDLATGAAAVAIIILVQGAGVAQSVTNPDGSTNRPSRDFTAQGAANIAAGMIQGMPVGGSLSQSALNVSAGARTRFASIISGVWLILFVLLFSSLIAKVAMPTLAALLILAGYRTINVNEIASIWQTGWSPRITILTTFTGTLFLPIQLAVGLGVALTFLNYLNQSAVDIRVVELVPLPDNRFEEREPPNQLPDHAITILDVYGSLFFAGARTLQNILPSPRDTNLAVVVLRMRGRTQVGATFIDVLDGYAEAIGNAGGRLYVAGVDPKVQSQLMRTDRFRLAGVMSIIPATNILGESLKIAVEDANMWLSTRSESAGLTKQDHPTD